MADQQTFSYENRARIQAVEQSFGPSGKPLYQPGRVLMGEGCLVKQSRRGSQPKVFFLFNDVLVYGSIILHGHWHKKQKIIPLEDIQMEDLEDSDKMKNQWLIRTPRKSFYVAAYSKEEKQAWMEHMERCRKTWLKSSDRRASSTFAVTWIPDKVSSICMRCSRKFTTPRRRHHCRRCGFVVCGSCSKQRVVLEHIHPTEQQRVCSKCHSSLQEKADAQDTMLLRGSSTEKMSSDDDDGVTSSDEEKVEEPIQEHAPSRWLDCQMNPWATYVYLRPEQIKPQNTGRES